MSTLHLDEDTPAVQGGEALMLMALTVMVLIALAAFWAIGTQAYTAWELHDPLVGVVPAQQPSAA